MKTLCKAAIIVFAGMCSSAQATPITWAGNGHSYELILDALTWQQARDAAVAKGGHLVTITSAAENVWLTNNILNGVNGTTGATWIGLIQPPGSAEPSGGWSWVTGEAFLYNNWDLDVPEPNNQNGENAGQFLFAAASFNDGDGREWNDLADNYAAAPYANVGYIVEYESVPDAGASVALLGLALAGIGIFWRKFVK
jgi:hypothetical protein